MDMRRFSLGVGVTSGASMAMSLLFTRIFSVTMYYHFAFLLVSLALLGIAVAGVAISLAPNFFREERIPWLSGLFAVLMAPLALIALSAATANPLSVDLSSQNTSRLILLYFTTALPFLASGFAISLAIAGAKDDIGRVYAFDMGGAALGCMAIVQSPSVKARMREPELLVHPSVGITDGARVDVVSPHGRITIRAVVTEDVHPECVVMPSGWTEANPNRLIAGDERDPISGFPALRSGVCRLEKPAA